MFVKICGMRRQEDLDAAAALGFGLCGFIFHPSSPRGLTTEEACGLDSHGMVRVGVFVRQDADAIEEAVCRARLDLVQLHGAQDAACLQRLARSLGRQRLVRVLWPEKSRDRVDFVRELNMARQYCALVLLDAGQCGGGHGRRLVLEDLPEQLYEDAWILAGGLTSEIFLELQVWPGKRLPWGLDFNSGLESTPGVKDHERMRLVMEKARHYAMEQDVHETIFPGKRK